MTVHLYKSTIDRLRKAVYWTPGCTISSLVDKAINMEIKTMEKELGAIFSDIKKTEGR